MENQHLQEKMHFGKSGLFIHHLVLKHYALLLSLPVHSVDSFKNTELTVFLLSSHNYTAEPITWPKNSLSENKF